jgi:hypothetical protein
LKRTGQIAGEVLSLRKRDEEEENPYGKGVLGKKQRYIDMLLIVTRM